MTNYTNTEKLHNGSSKNTPVICSAMNKEKKVKPLGERRKAVLRQELMVFLGNLGIIGGGMAIGLPSATITQLTDRNEDFNLNDEEASWYSSITTMSFTFGGFLVGYLMDRIGRKNTLLVTNLMGIIGWGLMLLAPYYNNHHATYIQLLVGRFFLGIMVGLMMSPVGVYSAEISLPKIRGRLVMGTSIGLALGIWLIYVLGYFIRNDWILVCKICGAYQVVSLLCVFPMPESPSWLMQKGRVNNARRSLKYFRGLSKRESIFCLEFEDELTQIKKTCDAQHETEKESLYKAIKCREVHRPILVMIGLFFFQQFSGIIVVIVLAVPIAREAGVAIDPVLVAVIVGGCRVITTFFVGSIFEKWGRKPAGIFSAIGMAICMYILAICGSFPIVAEKVPLLSCIALVMHLVLSTIGLLTLPFFLLSEVFPQRVRGSASGLTLGCGLFLSFIVLKIYPFMTKLLGSEGVFAFYGTISLIGSLYIFLLLPETRGRTLLEIEEFFRTGRRVSNAEVALRRKSMLKEPEINMIPEGDVESQEPFIKS